DRRLRRRAVGARAGAGPHPVPGVDLPPRHPKRRGALRLQHGRNRAGAAIEPARADAHADRLSLGRIGCEPMAEQSFSDALNEQISNEFAASQHYIGAAVYYNSQTLPQLAAFFYRQAVEERNHAMIMVQYLLDAGEEVQIPDIKSQQTHYDDVVGPVKMALKQEKRVT